MKIEWKLRQNTTTTLLITSSINGELWSHISFNTPVMMAWGLVQNIQKQHVTNYLNELK